MTERATRSRWLFGLSPAAWAGIAGGWLLFTAALNALRNPYGGAAAGAAAALLEACAWTALTCAAFAAARHWPLYGPGWTRRVPQNLAVWVGLAVLQTAVLYALDVALGGKRVPYWRALVLYAPGLLIIHMHVVATAHAVWFSRRRRERRVAEAEAEAQIVRQQLEVLRARLRPELVFRALDRIEALAERSPPAADTLLSDLGALLRRALRPESALPVPFAQEIAVLQEWLAVENALREHPIRLELEVEAASMDSTVSALALQPLVETLLYEASLSVPEPRTLRVRARPDGPPARLRVEAELKPGPAAPAPRAQAGLAELLRGHHPALDLRVAVTSESIRISVSASPDPP